MFAPRKMALIQIELNEVTAANPRVFQILRQPPLVNEWVKPAASGPPVLLALCSSCSASCSLRRQQQAHSRVASLGDCVCVCVCVAVSLNLCLPSSRSKSRCVCSLLLLSCLRVCLPDLSLFETSLHISHTARFLYFLFFANLHLNVATQRTQIFAFLSDSMVMLNRRASIGAHSGGCCFVSALALIAVCHSPVNKLDLQMRRR